MVAEVCKAASQQPWTWGAEETLCTLPHLMHECFMPVPFWHSRPASGKVCMVRAVVLSILQLYERSRRVFCVQVAVAVRKYLDWSQTLRPYAG